MLVKNVLLIGLVVQKIGMYQEVDFGEAQFHIGDANVVMLK